MPCLTMFNPHDVIVPFDPDPNTFCLPNFTHRRIAHAQMHLHLNNWLLEAKKNTISTLLLSRVNGGPLITSPPLSVFALL